MEIINYEPHCKISWFLKWGILYINIFRFFLLGGSNFTKKGSFSPFRSPLWRLKTPTPQPPACWEPKGGEGWGLSIQYLIIYLASPLSVYSLALTFYLLSHGAENIFYPLQRIYLCFFVADELGVQGTIGNRIRHSGYLFKKTPCAPTFWTF